MTMNYEWINYEISTHKTEWNIGEIPNNKAKQNTGTSNSKQQYGWISKSFRKLKIVKHKTILTI